jgi:hypothetical protein
LKTVRLLLALCALLLCSSLFAQADVNLNFTLTTSQSGDCSDECWLTRPWLQGGWLEGFDQPTDAASNVSFDGGWAYAYDSGAPLSWDFQCGGWWCSTAGDYYGSGSILITGPDGLTFAGQYLSGSYSGMGWAPMNGLSGQESASFDFTGQWSDGTYGYGTVSDAFGFIANPITHTYSQQAELQMFVAPEPGTLAMLGGSALALLGFLRKFKP